MTNTVKQHFRPVPIPPLTKDPKSIENAIKALTEAIETLTRQRGDLGSWAVTFTDITELGLVTEQEVNEHIAHRRGL